MWWVGHAWAYETDQLTARDQQLADATEVANRLMDDVLARAVDRVNDRSVCGDHDLASVARAVHHLTSRREGVWERGAFRAAGFGTFTAAIEGDPSVDRFGFEAREDLYGVVPFGASMILRLAGPCSTFEIGGVRMGSDKIDHFLDTGYHYFRAHTLDPALPVRAGTASERSFYGLFTSKTFSYADLRANWDGLRFYRALDTYVAARPDGCLEVTRPFDWREWASPEWDEVLNPPVYTRAVEEAVLAGLQANQGEVCASWGRWDVGGWREAALADTFAPPYASGPVPARRDPWQLVALCDPTREHPLTPSALRPRQEVRAQRQAASAVSASGDLR
ncbi:MAG: hypothetical protein ABMA64_07350 [Myxococcota bacterium]